MTAPSQEFEVEVTCPIPECKKTKIVKIPSYLFENKKMGTIKVQIHADICCEHEFIIFVGKMKGKPPRVRAYEMVDLAIDLSKIIKTGKNDQVFLKDLLKKYGDYAVSSCLHALMLNCHIIFLRTEHDTNQSNQITNLLNSFIPSQHPSDNITISHILESEYKKAKISNALVVNPQGVIANTPWSDISLDIEKHLIQESLEILDDSLQAMILKQELELLFNKSQFIVNIIKKDEIFEEDLNQKISQEYGNTISKSEMKLLKQIVEFRFKGNLKKIKIRSFSKLKEGLW
ncbi:hypothetical protein NEF87_002894 [Candidatus Lokiarchaeum ossiferum]|uniref:Uncharacterized protein n=1 Tax=Candidatus Lokiarchaeum ossiferum TaxID=2951803 RepID=A0ABY6HVL8_9ARCH|nr:hypothetical protein NEF87_002894 [Candidatus Lokiarchaeum sp. B-35]